MTFKDSVHSAFKQSFRIAGRATRSEFWLYMLFYIIVIFIASVFLSLPLSPALQQIIATITTTIVSTPSIALTIRRLHDVGKSGWWYVIYYCVLPIVTVPVMLLTYLSALTSHHNWLITLLIVLGILAIAFVIGGIAILVFLLSDSQPGDNRYGPNPKGITRTGKEGGDTTVA